MGTQVKRTLDGGVKPELERDETKPRYLVRIGFDTPLYLSTGEEIEHDGDVYEPSDVTVGGIRGGSVGAQETTIRLTDGDDSNNHYADLVQDENVVGKALEIWTTYIKRDGTHTTPALYFQGVCTSYDIDDMTTAIRASNDDLNTLVVPTQSINAANGYNHLPRDGEVLVWMGQKIVFEVR
jgi:hypothetical protein